MTTPKINPQIFREYDIRGIVGEDLTAATVELIGRAIGTTLKRSGGKTLTLGRDMRTSSDDFKEALSAGIAATGCDIIDIGRVPTPVLYFSLHHLKPDGGVMITGSHNPANFNGFKISVGLHSLHGEKIQALKGLIDRGEFESGQGASRAVNVLDDYIGQIAGLIRLPRKVRFVADGGNGCFGLAGPALFKRLGLDPVLMYEIPDGSFPNHHPDPTVAKNLADLIARVQAEGAELGIGFDGDADRIGVVDDRGNIIWGDQLLLLFARDLLKKRPGSTIVGEVKCSKNLFSGIEAAGGNAVMAPAGHSLIKKKMRETGALLAGEMSGHICFADNFYGFDDALFAACRLIEIVASSDVKLSEMLADVPKTATTPEIRIDCPDDQKFRIVAELTKTFRDRYDVVDIDGVRINFPNGWGLVRASNTQPVLVLRFEADDEAALDKIVGLVQKEMKKYEPTVVFRREA
ncbi:MAG: phosphomannomutase/phosphoglucomutase [Nitrospinaceae bacterium]|nr:MAG: phosphomannomutase/phosphoglucomutase [Nitrospinaceae bacterium]